MPLKTKAISSYIARFYAMFIGIIIYPFYLKYLGAEAYGLVGFFTMFQSWLALLDMGLSPTLTREAARLKHDPERMVEYRVLLRSIEFVFFVIAILITFTVWMGSGWISQHWLKVESIPLKDVAYCISLMGVMSGFRWFVSLYSGSIVGMERQIWYNSYLIVMMTFKSVGAFLLVKYVTQEPRHFFSYQLCIAVIELVVIRYKLYALFPAAKRTIRASFRAIKRILPFAVSIAYTSGFWVVVTQIDKLLLSHFIHLKEYGYYCLVIVLANAMMQMASPISQVLLPRMTSLLAQGREDEMRELYHKATQFVAVVMLAVAGCVAIFPRELLYAWTGNSEAADWGGPILFWYALSSAALSLSAFQYYLQYAYGKLKYHVMGTTYFGIFQILVLCLAVYYYGAKGAAIAWFSIHMLGVMFWTWFIHNKFVPGLHKAWLLRDIAPAMAASMVMLIAYMNIGIDFAHIERLQTFIVLIVLGLLVLACNALATGITRNIITLYLIRGLSWMRLK